MIGGPLRRAVRGVAPLALGVGLATCQIGEIVSPEPPGTLAVTPGGARDSAAVGSRPVRVQKIALTSTGPGTIAWTAARARGSAWLALSAASGSTPDTLTLSLDPAGLFVGVYHDTVRIAPADGSADPVTVAVRFTVQPCRERILAVGGAVTDSLVPADCEAPHRADRFAKLYRFTAAAAADSVTVVLRSTAFDPYVLVDSATAGGVPPLAESDRCGADAAAACVRYVLLPRAGDFFVEVTSAGTGAGTGAFTLEVHAPRAPGAPTGPAQFAADSVTPVAVGATIGRPAFVARAATSDPDLADSVALEVEVQPVGTPFGDTATATGTLVPAGGVATVRVEGLADNTMFRWQVRSRDQTGRTSAWVPFGGNAADAADIRVDVSEPPDRPTGLGQFRSDGTTGIAIGATTDEATVVFKGTVSDFDPDDQVRLEVEVRPFGTPFANVATGAGVLVANGTKASATVTGLLDGVAYHWQVRTVDQATQASDWVAFAASGQTSEDFRVVLPATRLAFATQPTGTTAGSPITPAVTVEARKASGGLDTAFAGTINVGIASGTGTSGAGLGGTVSLAAVRGVATFSNLSVNVAGTGYRLLASAAGLSSATSNAFDVSASGANRLALTTAPSASARSGIALTTQPGVQIRDAGGNAVEQEGVAVVATIASGPAGASLSGDTATTGASGSASFTQLAITGSVGSYTLRFDADGLTGVSSGTIAVGPGAADPAQTTASVPGGVAGQPTPIVVTVRDGAGNPLTVGGETVAITVTGANSASPAVTDNGNGTYTASYTPTASGSDAVAITLNGVAISGSPYTSVVAAAGGASLAFVVAPGTVVAGATITPAVQVAVRDANGNTVTSSTAAITIAIGANPGGGTLAGTLTVSASAGVATFGNLSIDRVGTGYTLTASAAGVAGATSTAFDVTPGAAAQLAFTGQPSDAVAGSTIAPPVLVSVQDASGNTVTSSTADITIQLDANPAGGALAGTLTVPAVNGVASFDDLSIQMAGAGYTLAAASDGLTGATSGSFEVTPAGAEALAFVVQPGNTVAGQTIAPPVQVAVLDGLGNVVSSSTAAVTIAIGTNPAGGTLSGTTTVNAASGIATFSDLSIDAAGAGYTLTVSSGGLTDATSTAFDVQVGSGRVLAFVVQPTDRVVGATITPAVQVAIQDELGNTVEDNATVVSLFLGNSRGAVLSGTTMMTAVNGVATFANLSVNQAADDYTLVATGASLISATSVPFSILPAATTTAVASSLNPSTVGQTVTFTATVTSGFGTPTGSLQFKVDGANLETPVTLNGAGVAQISTSSLVVGTRVITAEYAGATNFAPSVGTLTPDQVVAAAPTTTTVTSSTNPSVFGEVVIFTATVASSAGTPTGFVQFRTGGANLGEAVALDASGVAQTATGGLAVGTRVISAEYLGSVNFGPSVDTLDGGQVVNQAATTTAITGHEPDPSAVGDSVTVSYIVAVTLPGAGLVTGNVVVSDGAGTSCTGAVEAGSCRLAFSTAGTKTLTATYQGDGNFLASPASTPVNHTVSAPATTTAVASSVNPSAFGQGVTFTATVTSTGGTPTGTVQFSVNGVDLGTPVTLTDGEATSESVDTLAAATHTVATSYTPADGTFLPSPGTLAGGQVVNQAATTTTISSDDPDPSSAGGSVTVLYTVTANAPGSGAPTGNVTVADGFGASCTATVADGTCSITLLTAGTITLTATYAGDANFATSAGTASHQVASAATVTTVTSSQNPSVINQGVSFTATVTTEAGIPTGSVRFRLNGLPFTPPANGVTLVDGVATSPSYANIPLGTSVVTAEYLGSTNFASSADTLDGGQVVTLVPTTTTLASSPNPSVLGENVTFTATVTGGTGTPTGSVQFKADGVNLGGTVTLSSGVATTSTSSLAAGTREITAEYAGTATLAPSADTLDQVVAAAGAATRFEVTGIADPLTAGAASSVTVTARDAFENVATGYTGTVAFTTSDAGAVTLPDAYTFVAGDNGTHTFTGGVTLVTAGEQSVTGTDQAAPTLTGSQAEITVQAAAGSPAQTTASVPAGVAGSPTNIVITVLDAFGNKVTGAAAQLAGNVTGVNPQSLGQPVEQTGDTTYTTSYTPTLLGVDTVFITLGGAQISGSPYASTVGVGAAASVTVVEGDNQIGLLSKAVNIPPAVLVEDAVGNPVPGADVTFTVTGGSGSGTGTSVVTDASGVARVGSWTLGGSAGPNALQAAITGDDVTFAATGQAAAYDVEVRFFGTNLPTASQQAAFTNAAARWEQLIFGDVVDAALNRPADECLAGIPAINESIDDLVVYAQVTTIDGAGGILGQAGPCYVRGSGLPILGVMQFDSADVAQLEAESQLEFVILHEMGHVIGSGTLWDLEINNVPIFSLLANPCPSSGTCATDPHFVGAQGLEAFDAVGGTAYAASAKVPVEDTGGAGTRNGHWRETVFGTELMTGFISGGSNPLSVVSVGSFWDMGYLVNYADADAFTWSAAPPAFPGTGIDMGDDILRLPIGVVGAGGQIERVIQPSP